MKFLSVCRMRPVSYTHLGVEWPMPEGMTRADLILSDKDKVHGGFGAYCKERGIVR